MLTIQSLPSQLLLLISEEPCYLWTNQHHSETRHNQSFKVMLEFNPKLTTEIMHLHKMFHS